MRLYAYDTLPSTHQHCELLNLTQEEEFTVVWAQEQTAGIGQKGNHWESRKGENLTLSLILHPTLLPVADQYMLTKVLSLAMLDLLTPLLPQLRVDIKWPNDIYVNGKKICGILVSHQISGETIHSSICSIGLNVNQTIFSEWIPNPTSLALLTRKRYESKSLLENLVTAIEKRYGQLRDHKWDLLDKEYLSHLLNFQEEAQYIYETHTIFATIHGVNRFGHLQLVTREGEQISCEMKEIRLGGNSKN